MRSSNSVGRLLVKGVVFFHPLLFVQLYFAGNWYSITHGYSIGMVLGICSYSYLVLALLLATRLKLFDKLLGQDKVIRVHGYIAFLGVLLGIAHLFYKRESLAYPTVQTAMGSFPLLIMMLLLITTLLFMVDKFLLSLSFVGKIKRVVKEKWGLGYEHFKHLHNGFALAILFLIVHVTLASSTAETLTRLLPMALWGSFAVVRFCYHYWNQRVGKGKMQATVTAVDELNKSIVRIRFSKPNKAFKFEAGQFVYVRHDSKKVKKEEHPFTLSSGSHDSELEVTVKNLGDYTSTLKELQLGEIVSIDGPYGTFTPAFSEGPLLFIAGGIGITPFFSFLKSFDGKENKLPVHLLWSCSYLVDFIELEYLRAFEERNSWFAMTPCISREDIDGFVYGRIDKGLLEKEVAVLENANVYICGPEKMSATIEHELKTLPVQIIEREKFSF